MTTYAEFKEYVTLSLWKMGDSVVIGALDLLIKQAEASLNRDLMVERRAKMGDVVATTSDFPMPTDCYTVRHIHIPNAGVSVYVSPSDFNTMKDYWVEGVGRYYTTVGNTIRLLGTIDASNPYTLNLTYYTKIPSYKDDDTSWVAEDFFDLYLYTVLKQTGPFLREDERLPMWNALAAEALASALAANEDMKYAGSPLRINFGIIA